MKFLRALTRMRFRRNPLRHFGLARTKYDYLAEVGDGTGSSTVMAPLLWIARTFPEAPPAIWKILPDGQLDPELGHPMLKLLRRPNEFYSGANLWKATLIDYYVDGNAYWIKMRDNGDRLAELWFAPSWMIEPKGTETEFITHYEYKPQGGEGYRLPPSEVVHFRFGLDADDLRKGRAPLKSVLREVFTDDEAANFTASLLRNMGVPGLVISPDMDQPPSDMDVEATKAYVAANFTTDKRGMALVLSGRTKVEQFGFSPEQLNLKDIRRIPEERVTAVLGVPAMVAGLGAGLDRSTFTNYAEARQAAYEQTIIPTQKDLSEDIAFQLLPDFESNVFAWQTGFDLKNVRVLQEDRNKLEQRLNRGVRAGVVKRSEYRRALDHTVTDQDDVYLMPMNTVTVAADGTVRTFADTNQNSPNGANMPTEREAA